MTAWHPCPDCDWGATTTTGLANHGRQIHGWPSATRQIRPGPPLPAADAWMSTDPTGSGHDDDPRWRADAACRGANPGLFFPGRYDAGGVAAAKAICAGCPVQADCLTYALDHGEKFGIWGGTTERERRRLRGWAA